MRSSRALRERGPAFPDRPNSGAVHVTAVVDPDHRDLTPGLVDAVQHSIGPSASGEDAVKLSTQRTHGVNASDHVASRDRNIRVADSGRSGVFANATLVPSIGAVGPCE